MKNMCYIREYHIKGWENVSLLHLLLLALTVAPSFLEAIRRKHVNMQFHNYMCNLCFRDEQQWYQSTEMKWKDK